MTALRAILEDFEKPASLGNLGQSADDVRVHEAASAAYAEGYAAGQAAGASQVGVNQQTLDLAALQLNSVFVDLSSQLKIQFCDAVKAAIEKVFPMLAEKGFADACAAAVADAAIIGDNTKVTLKVSPSQEELLKSAFLRFGGDTNIIIEADAELSELEVKADWDNAGLELDFDAAIKQSLTALENTIAQIKDRT